MIVSAGRIHAQLLEVPLRAVLDHLVAAGGPIERAVLSRRFGKIIGTLEHGGHLFATVEGGLFLTPLTVRELKAYAPWSDAESDRLAQLWISTRPIVDVAGDLGRSGGDVLQKAWELGLKRRPPVAEFEATPAWRIRRLRASLAEAERRGLMMLDDGHDLKHRALRRRFDMGRALAKAKPEKHFRKWTSPEDAELRALRDANQTIAQIAARLGRSFSSVGTRLSMIGLSVDRSWTIEEDIALTQAVRAKMRLPHLLEMLPGRSRSGIHGRIKKLGLNGFRAPRPWTAAEREALFAVARAGGCILDWCKANGRGESAAHWQMQQAGVRHVDNSLDKMFTAAEDQLIRDMRAAGKRPREIAAALGRSLSSTHQRTFKLGLTKGEGSMMKPISPREIELAQRMAAAGVRPREIAAAVGRTLAAFYRMAAKSGIRFPRGPRPKAPEALAA